MNLLCHASFLLLHQDDDDDDQVAWFRWRKIVGIRPKGWRGFPGHKW